MYDFWLRVYEAEGDVFVYNPEPTFYYRQTDDSKHIKRKKNREEYLSNRRLREELQEYHRKIIIKKFETVLNVK